MVIPGAATTVGNQMLVFGMELNKSLLALIIPGLGGVYGMYSTRIVRNILFHSVPYTARAVLSFRSLHNIIYDFKKVPYFLVN